MAKQSPKLKGVLKRIGLRTRELRRQRGLTQEETAAKLDLEVQNYSDLERGKRNVTVNTLLRVAAVLGVDIAELFVVPKARKVRPGRPRKTE